MTQGLRGRNGALFFKPSETASDERGRNMPDANFDGFGNFSPYQAPEYIPFELERAIVRVQISRRRDEAGRFVA